MLGADGTPRYVNDSYLEMMGFSSFEQILEICKNRPLWGDILSEVDIAHTNEAVRTVAMDGLPTKSEHRLLHPQDPSIKDVPRRFNRWVEAINFPEYDVLGNVTGLLGFIVDISDRKLAEELQIQRLNDALETKVAAENFIDTGT